MVWFLCFVFVENLESSREREREGGRGRERALQTESVLERFRDRESDLIPHRCRQKERVICVLIGPVCDEKIGLNTSGTAKEDQSEGADVDEGSAEEIDESSFTEYANGIINEIRTLVSAISSEKSRKTKSKEAQESILQEIEKLAAEAYSIFRSTVPTFTEEAISESEELPPSENNLRDRHGI